MTESEFGEMERRLENWRMVVTGQGGHGHCGSAESMYVGGRDEGRRAPSLVLDDRDAWRIEQAWKALSIDHYRWLIKLHYVRRMEQRLVIRAVLRNAGYAIKRWHYRAELIYAVTLLKKSLDIIQREPHDGVRQFEQVTSAVVSVGRREAVFARPEESKPAAAR